MKTALNVERGMALIQRSSGESLMPTTRTERLEIRSSDDVVKVRQQARTLAVEAGLSSRRSDQDHHRGQRTGAQYAGLRRRRRSAHGSRRGRRPARPAPDLRGSAAPASPISQQAMKDGFTTGSGLGLGLGGAKRLSNEFAIEFEARRRHQDHHRALESLMISVADQRPKPGRAKPGAKPPRLPAETASTRAMPAASRWSPPSSAPI